MTRLTENKKNKKAQQAMKLYPRLTNFIEEEVKVYYSLDLTIHCAEGMDPLDKYAAVINRNYRVVACVNPGNEFVTGKAEGYPSVTWNHRCQIPLGSRTTFESNLLKLEAIRERSKCDPGSSKGVVVVGRAEMPLRLKVDKKTYKRIGLVRFVDGAIKGEGHIVVSMTLKVY